MQVRYKYLQDCRRSFSSCKPNEEWLHTALALYNEKEKELFYMKWLMVDMYKGGSRVQISLSFILHFLIFFLCGLKSTNLKALKMELLFIYKEKFRLESLNTPSFFYEQFYKNTGAHFPHILFIFISTWYFHVWSLIW